MERLKQVLEDLDEALFALEDKVAADLAARRAEVKRQIGLVKKSRTREVELLASAQKVAARLDEAIEHVERIARH